MAFSYVLYTGNGSNRTFAVPFPYLERNHIRVKIDDVQVGYRWLSNGSIQTNSTPANGAVVEVRRFTPNVTPLVTFIDGATLTERDLNVLSVQALFMNQEAVDLAEELAEELENEFEEDITAIRSSLRSINTRALAAQSSANDAKNTSDSALALATSATNTLADVSSQVNTDVAAIAAALSAASASADAAIVASEVAEGHAADAATQAGAAEASAVAAAAAAATAVAAANFDPDDFYTKDQVDGLLSTTSFTQSQITGLSTALAGKANVSHTHAISEISGLSTDLAGRVPTTRTVSTSNGLTGGGALSADRSLSLTGQALNLHNLSGSGLVMKTGAAGSGTFAARTLIGSTGINVSNGDGVSGNPSISIDNTVARTTVEIRAGNGMTGGGAISATRVLTLGTPSSITATSTNSVTSTSHTHAITSATIRTLIAEGSNGQVGSYAFLRRGRQQNIVRGNNYTSSDGLRYSGSIAADDNQQQALETANNDAPPGTWKAMGTVGAVTNRYVSTLFLRIA
jgi:hypothetical protein